jgi:hypothetical protein
MKPRQVVAFGLEDQFVIHVMSPCIVAGDIMNMCMILISRRPKSGFSARLGLESGSLGFVSD